MESKNKCNSEKVTSVILADVFGLTARRIQQLVSEGVITAEKAGKGYKFDLRLATKQYIKYITDKTNGSESGNALLERERLEADVALKKSKAAVAEIELAEYEGRMHRADDVAELTADLVYAVRSMFVSLPGRLAMDLSIIDNPQEATDRIKKESIDMLTELSNYSYDPSKYHEKVQERQGWQNEMKEITQQFDG
ncbi:MAG: protoporphyrinogen oxidase [Clostridiales Family XIII bacterium]|jgi:phage terminase Nu1 subunit (DNA packaging protein)|nr:protoporphyrinogen oxidase [Clostridiales Family XIII bacterium]